jgi:hypothetical protein
MSTPASAVGKAHVITFGKWQVVRLDGADFEAIELRVRALFVDGKLRDYTVGQPHDITDRIFAVERASRLNDELPNEKQPRWTWQRGGWIQVDRSSGHISSLHLPNFDPQLSVASWYRDYIAYCGDSEDETHLYAMVMQLGVRRPILRKEFDATATPATADPVCAPPAWRRKPIRIEFNVTNGPNLTFTIRGRAFEVMTANEDDPE